jgi:HEPN domain-containing protein
MRPDSGAPGSPEDWLRHARSDLALAVAVGPVGDVLAETLCFHAQQAAEKALKAVLINVGVEFPRTHSLRLLVDLLPSKLRTEPMPESAVTLTDYAVTVRYPGEIEPIGERELEEAIRLAQGVVRWADSLLRGAPPRAFQS